MVNIYMLPNERIYDQKKSVAAMYISGFDSAIFENGFASLLCSLRLYRPWNGGKQTFFFQFALKVL